MNDFFDRVVAINLLHRTDRRAHIERLTTSTVWPFKKAEMFQAVDGSKVTLPTSYAQAAGEYGVFCSHVGVLRDALEVRSGNLLVLEDDAVLTRPAAFKGDVEMFLGHLPDDWDMVYLGGICWYKLAGVNPFVCRAFDVVCLHAYAIRSTSLFAIYSALSHELDKARANKLTGIGRHVDHAMRLRIQHNPKFRVYAPNYSMFCQPDDGFASDIREKKVTISKNMFRRMPGS